MTLPVRPWLMNLFFASSRRCSSRAASSLERRVLREGRDGAQALLAQALLQGLALALPPSRSARRLLSLLRACHTTNSSSRSSRGSSTWPTSWPCAPPGGVQALGRTAARRRRRAAPPPSSTWRPWRSSGGQPRRRRRAASPRALGERLLASVCAATRRHRLPLAALRVSTRCAAKIGYDARRAAQLAECTSQNAPSAPSSLGTYPLGKKCGRCSTRLLRRRVPETTLGRGGHDKLCKPIKKAGGQLISGENQRRASCSTTQIRNMQRP